MAILPSDVQPYRTTPTYTEKTVPAGLTGRHATKEGVWGAITVVDGRLKLYRLDSTTTPEMIVPGSPGIVAPQEVHRVEADGPEAFHVIFHRA